jgi:pimeloyl-ACP methyl ester carboxylesterase
VAATPEHNALGRTRRDRRVSVWLSTPSIPHSIEAVVATTSHDRELQQLGHPPRAPRGRIALIVVASLAAGVLVALVLVAAPFNEPRENVLTGMVLLGFAFGWAMLAVLSQLFSDQPQRWAAAPALFFALAGVISLIGSEAVNSVWGWIWPPILLALVVWIVIRARQRLRSPTRRWLLYPLLAVLALSAIGGGYQTVAESIDATAYPMPGQLIDVGGHRLHLNCSGSGSPTVVLEPGMGAASLDMAWIAPAVARDSRVCVYDRAGRGWSDAADGPQDAAQTATDLHTLLERAHIPGPYVLAGHSFGGLYVLTFAAKFPDQVAGMVLLDSTAPAHAPAPTRQTRTGSYDLGGRIATLLPAVAHLGAVRVVGQSSYGTLPPRSRDEARATSATASYFASYITEFREGATATQLTDFGSKPLIVITAGRGHDAESMLAQDKLATLSTNSRHRVVPQATHQSLLLDETDAAAASRSIRDVVVAARTGRPLPPP